MGMTIAEQLRHEGEQRGMLKRREEARLEGIEEGECYAILKVARKMLTSGLDSAMVMRMTGPSETELPQTHH
jgi:predicted transposase/invertase (TIGR01784 family)